jgi:superfamily II DNA or RNA helicase
MMDDDFCAAFESQNFAEPEERLTVNKKSSTNDLKVVSYVPTGDKKIFLTKTGAFINFSDITHKNDAELLTYIKRIENYFTIRAIQLIGNFKQLKSCIVDKKKKRIIVPRFGIYELLSDEKKFGLVDYSVKSQIKYGEDLSKKLEFQCELTHNQQIIADHINKYIYTEERLAAGSTGLILNLAPGNGKTYLATSFIGQIDGKTIIILHTVALIEQWENALKECYGDDISIGYYYAKKKVLGDIMIMIIDSACNDTFTFKDKTMTALEFYNRFRFIIYDECHTYANQSSLKAFHQAQAPYVMGLSATPDENTNGFDQTVYWEIGPVLISADLPGFISTTTAFTAKIHRMMYYGPPEYTKVLTNDKTGMLNIAGTINMICDDIYRSTLIVDSIYECRKLNLYTLVLADRREYLEQLRQLYIKKYADNINEDAILTTKEEFIRLVGGVAKNDMVIAEKKSNVIFASYQFLGTGVSFPKLNGLILATPRKSKISQYVGRIFRLGSDQSIKRLIYDVVDMKTKLAGQYSTRKRYYIEQNYEIEESKIKYNDIKIVELHDRKKEHVSVAENKIMKKSNAIDIANQMLAKLTKK